MGWTACVYVIATDTGEVKVGWSSTPYARVSKIRREYGPRRGFAEAWLVGFVPTPRFLDVEIAVHRRLEPLATGGEWFRADPMEALRVVAAEAMCWEDRITMHLVRQDKTRLGVTQLGIRRTS